MKKKTIFSFLNNLTYIDRIDVRNLILSGSNLYKQSNLLREYACLNPAFVSIETLKVVNSVHYIEFPDLSDRIELYDFVIKSYFRKVYSDKNLSDKLFTIKTTFEDYQTKILLIGFKKYSKIYNYEDMLYLLKGLSDILKIPIVVAGSFNATNTVLQNSFLSEKYLIIKHN